MDNIITVSFGALRSAKTRPVWLVDHGMILQFKNLELPQVYEVHFSNDKKTPAKTSIGDADGVVIPDEYFHNAERIFAWLYLHNGESGYTVYEVEIPLRPRPEVSDVEPTPQQETAIEQAITALNAAVEQTAADVQATGRDAQTASDAAESATAQAALAAEYAGAAAAAQTAAEAAQVAAERAQGKAEDAQSAAELAQGKAEDAQGYAEAAAIAAQADADFLHNASATATTLEAGSSATAELSEGVFTFGIPRGADGEDGTDGKDGKDGEDGSDGFSPIISVTDISGGHRVTVTDKNGTRTFDVMDGIDGEDGDDGVSPTITVTSITGGHRVSITDATGTETFDVMDGQNPSDLDAGDIAFDDSETYPAETVGSEISSVKSALSDKVDWDDAVGYGLYKNSGKLRVYSAPDSSCKAGTSSTALITPQNEHSATFYGFAKAAGDSTQSSSSNAVGTYTESAKSAISEMLNGSVSVSGSTPSITAKAGVRYVCGECSTLTITVPATGIVDVVFSSGSTATVLTITPPTGQTVTWANGFDPTSLEAETVYELNIMDLMGVSASWT